MRIMTSGEFTDGDGNSILNNIHYYFRVNRACETLKIRDLALHLYKTGSDDEYGYDILFMDDGFPVGFLYLNRHHAVINGVDIDCHIPHSYLAEEYRGKGIMYECYSWAAHNISPLVTHYQHSKSASNLWRWLVKGNPFRVIRSEFVLSNQKEYELMYDVSPGDVTRQDNFRFIIGNEKILSKLDRIVV